MSAERRSKDEPMPREAPTHKEPRMHEGQLMNKDWPTNKEGPINKEGSMNRDEPTRKLAKTGTHRAHRDSISTQAPIREKQVASETSAVQANFRVRGNEEHGGGRNTERNYKI